MKGALQELGEPVDDLMTVSKVQTQILNLTHNQVNVFDQATGEFRSTYDILKDISEVWDSLSATSRASLTEILFGRQRSNVGLALIQAFQSGQVEKAYEDALNAAGTATDEYNKMMEGIQAHLDSLKGVFQELSIAVMDGSAIKEIINDGIELLTLLTNIINAFNKLKALIPQTLFDVWDWVKKLGSVVFPIDSLLEAAKKLNDIAKELGLVEDTKTSKNEASNIENTTEKYIQLAAANADAKEMTAKLGKEIEDINAKYTDNKDKIDLVNKSLSENLTLLRQIKKEEIGKQLSEDSKEYKKAQDYLTRSSKYKEGYDYGEDNNAFYMNAKGIKRYTDKQYAAFARLNLSNYVSTKDTNHLYDFVLTGTPEEQLKSLKKIRNAYAEMDDMQQARLDQFDEEIERLNNEIELNKEKIATYEKLQQTYNSIAVLSAQEANMIEQATNAYQQYQEARASGDTELADNALQSLNSIKDIVYSISDPDSGFRNEFDNFWNEFNLGSTEAKSNLEELQEEFDQLIDKDFSAEVKNLDAIDKAIESMMNDETLSHDDAWNIIKLDTDGILNDIKLVNGEYKLSTDQLTQLMQQRIEKQKESLMSIKAEAEAELELAKLRLSNLKYDPTKGAKEFAIEVSNARDEIRSAQNMVGKMGYLIDELNSRLAKTSQLTSDFAKELNNTVNSLEAEVKAIEDTIDELNGRKDILESEKKELQDQLELLKEQKKALEDQQKSLKNAVDKYMKRYEESLKNQLDAIKQQKEDIKDEYDERIKALKTENEERDLAYKKEKALLDLNKAKDQQVRTYSSARGWEYGVSKEKLAEAQKNLEDVLADEQIQALEKERDEKISSLEKQEKEYDKRIKAYQEYAQKYEETTEIIENADGELLAEQLLGADWREKIERQDEGLLASYKKEYSKFADEIDRLTKNEIADIEASIKAKEAEIDEIGKEIKAYNNYKDTVKKGLDEAKKALEEYKTSVESAKTEVVNSMSGMADGVDTAENRIWDKHNRIIQWLNEIREAAEGLDSALGIGGASARAMGIFISGSHAKGGVADYTGLAMLHGSKSSPETIFNANDSKKLYDMIHNTPNVMAAMMKQATQIAGFKTSNVSNNTANSINVSIGQIVANNPQELTQNLDTHLESYFRRKLTQGYAQ